MFKKIIYTFILLFSLTINFDFGFKRGYITQDKTLNSSNDAILRGFEISGSWEYVDDVNKNQISLDGSSYHYGYMDSWMGIYKYYDFMTDEMIILLLSQVEAKPRQDNYWDQKRFNNQEIQADFSASLPQVHYLNYAPKVDNGTLTTSYSFTVNAGVSNGSATLGSSITIGQSYSTSEVPISAFSSTEARIVIKYSFSNYDSNTSTSNICCSTVDRLNLAIFKIPDYEDSWTYRFTIKNKVTMYRYGVFNSSSVTEQQEQTFEI